MLHWSPLRQGKALHGAEGAGFQPRVASLKFVDELLDLLPVGVPIGWTGIFDYGPSQPRIRVLNQILATIEERANLGDAGPI